MTLWVVRAGDQAAYDRWTERFLEDEGIYLTWPELSSKDLEEFNSRDELRAWLEEVRPGWGKRRISNYVGQIWSFVKEIKSGDWVVLPGNEVIHVGVVQKDYRFKPCQDNPNFSHYRKVKWVAKNISRSKLDQDLQRSLGSQSSIYQSHANKAEERIRELVEGR